MESDLSTSSFSIDNILKPDKCDSSQEPRSADRALTLAERLAGEYRTTNACFIKRAACHQKLHSKFANGSVIAVIACRIDTTTSERNL